MKVEIILPQMGESVSEGTILKWFKKPGERVELDEILFEISTDKVDSEIPSPASGVVAEVNAEEGETVDIGSVLGFIETDASQVKTVEKSPKPEEPVVPKSPPGPEPSKEPAAETPQKVSGEPPVPSVQAVPPPPPPVTKPPVTVPEKRKVVAPAEEVPSVAPVATPSGAVGMKFYSPLVLKIAQIEGIPLGALETLQGTGIGGRITKKDILANLERLKHQRSAPAVTTVVQGQRVSAPATAKPDLASPSPGTGPDIVFSDDGTSVVPMDNMRSRIAEHMTFSIRTSVHVTTVSEADVTDLVSYRNRENQAFIEKEGFSLNYTSFVARALVLAIQEFPVLNASIEGKNIVYKKHVNIGIAVALEKGLIVPVVKHADEKNLIGIAREIHDLSTRARTKKLLPDEVQDSTISITNFGSFGNLFGTPIINQPNVAIVGVGAIKKKPVVIEDAIAIRDMMYLTLTFDHRIVDGAEGGMFLKKIVEYIEKIEKLV